MIEWIKNFFNGFNETQFEEPELTFVEKLHAKGFRYNEEHKWYQRTWSTPLPEGEGMATCLEVYREQPEGEWNALMYGGDGGLFYEHPVNGINLKL